MRGLVESGATLLLVSHALDHVTMFCDEAIWIDRGRIVKRGSSLEVTKAYQQFTRVLDERRLNAKNRKNWEGTTPSYALDDYADALDLRLRLADGGSVEIDRVRLLRDGKVEEEVAVGDAQDADGSHAAHLVLEGSDWTSPLESGGSRAGCAPSQEGASGASGSTSTHSSRSRATPSSSRRGDVACSRSKCFAAASRRPGRGAPDHVLGDRARRWRADGRRSPGRGGE